MLYNIVIATNILYEKTRTNHGKEHSKRRKSIRQHDKRFIKEEIIPHFEYGTFIDGEGLWKGEFEQTKIFYIEVADTEAIATAVLLKHIADKYSKAFQTGECASFRSVHPDNICLSLMHYNVIN